MKFLVDAHLPVRLVDYLVANGHDAIHVSTLSRGFETSDAEITAFADADQRLVVSKDADFVNSHLVAGRPARLLVIKTGNISNAGLIAIFEALLTEVVSAYSAASYVELHRTVFVVNSSRSD
ncbi:MAG: DUF5615 family PIN-like protein [Micropruina sp.]|mgnify:CR=1 FL=1|nr:DUF5615 family PIN-like protein [Micropruina sp.]